MLSSPLSSKLRNLSFVLIVCAGCSSGAAITSTQITGTARSPVGGGITYYLPKRLLEIGVWETTFVRNGEVTRTQYFATFGTTRAKEPVRTVPDRNYLMRLAVNNSSTSHDNVKVELTTDGLLTLVDTTFDDQSALIVAKLADLARLAAGVPVGGIPKSEGGTEGDESQSTRLAGRVFVDPTDPATCTDLDELGITLTATPLVAGACCDLSPNPLCEPVRGQSGVCYRPVVPYRVKLKPGGILSVDPTNQNREGGEELLLGAEELFMLPNRSPVVCLPIERVPFVKSKFTVTFDRGLLTSMTSDKPSEVIGFLEIPINVAKAIVSIPAELLQFKITHYENVNKSAKAERDALEAIKELSKSQNAADPYQGE